MRVVRNEKGVLLLDISIALMIIGMMAAPLAEFWLLGEKAKIRCKERTIAAEIAQEKMESLKGWEDVTIGSDGGHCILSKMKFSYRIDVCPTDWEGLVEIQVSVWPSGHKKQCVTLTTLKRVNSNARETTG